MDSAKAIKSFIEQYQFELGVRGPADDPSSDIHLVTKLFLDLRHEILAPVKKRDAARITQTAIALAARTLLLIVDE